MAQRDQFIEEAKSWVGYLEKASNSQLEDFTANAGSNNYTIFWVWYNQYMGVNFQGQAWCQAFVTYDAYHAGMTADQIFYGAYCPYGVTWFKNRGQWHARSGYTPQEGDIIYFQSNGVACHVGIVYKVDSSKVYTIEGNTSGASGLVSNGGGVAMKSYALSSSYIMGYGTPLYSDEETLDEYGCPYPEPTGNIQPGSTGSGVRWVQWRLNALGYSIGSAGIDGDCGADTVAAIKKFQTDNGLEADGIVGAQTRGALNTAMAAKFNEEDDDMTEEQVKKIVKETLAGILTGENTEVSDWAKEELAEAVAAGITDGTRPLGYATRQESAIMTLRAYKGDI